MKLALSAALALAASLALSPLAEAGNLGKTTRSIGKKQSQSRSGGGTSAPPRPRDYRPRSRPVGDAYYRGSGHYHYVVQPAGCAGCGAAVAGSAAPSGPPARVDIFATYENVRESDGSLNLGLRVAKGPLGLGFASSSYFESARLDKGEPEEHVRMSLWDASAQGRVLRIADATELWLSLGLTGLHSNQFADTFGGSLGGELRHRVTGALRLEGGARGMIYGDDIKASELRAGVTASVLHVGYRYLRFNVGPALQGPELGLSLQF